MNRAIPTLTFWRLTNWYPWTQHSGAIRHRTRTWTHNGKNDGQILHPGAIFKVPNLKSQKLCQMQGNWQKFQELQLYFEKRHCIFARNAYISFRLHRLWSGLQATGNLLMTHSNKTVKILWADFKNGLLVCRTTNLVGQIFKPCHHDITMAKPSFRTATATTLWTKSDFRPAKTANSGDPTKCKTQVVVVYNVSYESIKNTTDFPWNPYNSWIFQADPTDFKEAGN